METRKGKLVNKVTQNDGLHGHHDLIKFLEADKGFEVVFYKSSFPKALSDISTKAFIAVNNAWEEFTGFSQKEIIGLTADDLKIIKVEERTHIRRKLDDSGKLKSYEAEIFVKDGSTKKVFLSFDKITLQQNDYVLSEILDITELKKSQELLKVEKEFSQNVLASLHEGLVVIDKKGELIEVNPAFCEMTGFKKEEILGSKRPRPYWPPESCTEIEDAFSKTLSGKQTKHILTFMRKNGERFPTSLSTASLKDSAGDVIAYFSTFVDVSSRIKAENDIIAAKEFSENILTSMQEGLIVVSIDEGKVTSVNPSFCEMTGYTEEELLSTTSPFPFWVPEYYDTCISHYKKLVNEEFHDSYETLYKRKNGERFPVQIISSQIIDKDGSATAILATIRDITERKLAERDLISLNKELTSTVAELAELKNRLQNENIYLRDELDLVFNFEEMVYGSAEFGEVLSNVEKVAPTKATVLLLGDTGTGKELLARAVHNLSARKDKPLIKVNCAAIPKELIESELFGHKKGSFTGAVADKVGKVELANGGTLFLDEIGELPLSMQPKLLRFLQEGEIEKIGENNIIKLDVRVIAATNRNLKNEVEKKKFREDLYFRLNVFPIHIPPLHERPADIPLLVEHFVDKFGKIYRKEIKYISDAAMHEMQKYRWPGNIRELENLIERAVILSDNEYLQLPNFENSELTDTRTIANTNLSLDEVNRNHIIKVLEKCDWKIDGKQGAAQLLKIKSSTLRDRMKKLNIQRPD